MGRYIGTADVLNYISPAGAIGTTQNGLIGTCINWAEGMIDDYTRRNFAGTGGTILYNRYFQDRVVNNTFYLDRDLYSLTQLTTGVSQSIPAGSTWLEPQSGGPPYRGIRLHSSYVYSWNTDQDMIVVGTWGFSTVAPQDIQYAAVRLAAYLFRLKDVGPGDVSGFTEAGEVTYPKGIPDDVKIALAPFRSRTGGVV